MKITKQRLQQIINEEIDLYKNQQIEQEQLDEGLQDTAKALAFALMMTAAPQAAMAVGTPAQTTQTGDPAEAEEALNDAANLIGQAIRALGADKDPEAMQKVQDMVDDLNLNGEAGGSGEMEEKLKPSDGAGDYVDDFQKSDAPQFKGKSKKKKQQMAVAAYLDDKDGN